MDPEPDRLGSMVEQNTITTDIKDLTDKEREQLARQDTRIISEFQAQKLENLAQKNWDLFYKRNETNFYKDRNWTTREFEELLSLEDGRSRKMLEVSPEYMPPLVILIFLSFQVGCGVGNLVYPLLQDPRAANLFFYACDFSQRAVDFVKANDLYDPSRILAFQCDITDMQQLESHVEEGSLDLITMIFVLSAIHPDNFKRVVCNLVRLLKPGGVLLFRDYGRYDMAQLRFKPGSKIADNLYVRQDGTR